MKRPTISATLVLILIAVACLLTQAERTAAEATVSGIETVPGELDLRTPDGQQVYLTPYIGRKAIVVVFWATWCPICISEVPHLNRLNSNPLVKVIGVNEGESLRKIRNFVVSNRVVYEVVVDPQATVAKSFGVPGVPFCVIIGKSGLIDYRGSGLPENLDVYLKQ